MEIGVPRISGVPGLGTTARIRLCGFHLIDIVVSRVRHNHRCCTTMSRGTGYHNCKAVLNTNVLGFLYSLRSSTYDKMTPKIEFWIEYIINEGFSTPKDLAEQLSGVAWHSYDINTEIPRFLKAFRDAPGRSEPTRFFVDEFCLRVLRWFAGASTDYFQMDDSSSLIPNDTCRTIQFQCDHEGHQYVAASFS